MSKQTEEIFRIVQEIGFVFLKNSAAAHGEVTLSCQSGKWIVKVGAYDSPKSFESDSPEGAIINALANLSEWEQLNSQKWAKP